MCCITALRKSIKSVLGEEGAAGSAGNGQVKHCSHLHHLTDIHRQKSQWLHLRIRTRLVLYQTWLKKDELDSLQNEV